MLGKVNMNNSIKMSADYEESSSSHAHSEDCHSLNTTTGLLSFIPHNSIGASSSFFDWRDTYPELDILIENIDVIRREADKISSVSCYDMIDCLIECCIVVMILLCLCCGFGMAPSTT